MPLPAHQTDTLAEVSLGKLGEDLLLDLGGEAVERGSDQTGVPVGHFSIGGGSHRRSNEHG